MKISLFIKALILVVSIILLVNSSASQDKLIWTGFGQGVVGMCDIDGSNGVQLLTLEGGGSQGLTIDREQEQMYITSGGDILVYDFNTEVLSTVFSGSGFITAIALDTEGKKLYWSNLDEDQILEADLTGDNVRQVYSDISLNVLSMDYHKANNSIIFGRQNGVIGELLISEGTVNQLTEIEHLPTELEIDDSEGKVYFINQFTLNEEISSIIRCNLDGTDQETVVSGLGNPFGLAVSTTAIYWTDWDSDFTDIRSSDKDGNTITDLFNSSNSSPYALAIYENFAVSTSERVMQPARLVYPNPTNSTIHISNSLQYDEAILTNAEGKVVVHHTTPAALIQIDDLPLGLYMLSLYHKGQLIATDKVMKR